MHQAWVSDITYIKTRQGWLYLATTLDLFSRQIVGWAMDDNTESQLNGARTKHGYLAEKDAKRRYITM